MLSKNPTQEWAANCGPRFVERAVHRQWLLQQAMRQFAFFQRATVNPAGGFFALDDSGRPLPAKAGQSGVERQLPSTTRMVHCFAMAHLLGLPGADRVIDHGMDFLWQRHRDAAHGGYFWGVDDAGPTQASKQAYGHAFVLLAASSAKTVGHPDAARLFDDVHDILRNKFWDQRVGTSREEFTADWQVFSSYRGQNSNMHLTEALMAAYEATQDRAFLSMAQSIAELIIDRHARNEGWRVAEHFDEAWNIDRDYAGDPMFRPRGTTPGHALEWSRLLAQLWELGGRQNDWLLQAAQALFENAVRTAWDDTAGGFFYTLDWNDRPDHRGRFWWPCAEGIAAAAVLGGVTNDPFYELWYRRIWSFVENHFIDPKNGSWYPELDDRLEPTHEIFAGRPDLYHSVQACLIPLVPTSGSVTRNLQSVR